MHATFFVRSKMRQPTHTVLPVHLFHLTHHQHSLLIATSLILAQHANQAKKTHCQNTVNATATKKNENPIIFHTSSYLNLRHQRKKNYAHILVVIEVMEKAIQ